MQLGFLMLTDHSEVLNGKVYAMGGGWNMLRFAELPVEHGFGIAFGLDVPWDETNQRHTLRLEIEDPDGERLGDEFSFEFETGRPPGLGARARTSGSCSRSRRGSSSPRRPARGRDERRRAGDRPQPLLRARAARRAAPPPT